MQATECLSRLGDFFIQIGDFTKPEIIILKTVCMYSICAKKRRSWRRGEAERRSDGITYGGRGRKMEREEGREGRDAGGKEKAKPNGS